MQNEQRERYEKLEKFLSKSLLDVLDRIATSDDFQGAIADIHYLASAEKVRNALREMLAMDENANQR